MVSPVMPRKSAEILAQLGLPGSAPRWPTSWNQELAAGGRINKGAPLFPRIDETRAAELLARWLPEAAKAPVAPSLITYDDFQKLDLRSARILSATRVPKADKLLKIEVDLGEERRQVVAGIAEAYQPEELVGRQVIFVANLQPATIRGIESQGMILAAGDRKVLALAAIDREVPTGTKVR